MTTPPAMARATLSLRVDTQDRDDLLEQVLRPLRAGNLPLRLDHVLAGGTALRLGVTGPALRKALHLDVVVVSWAAGVVHVRMPAEQGPEHAAVDAMVDALAGRSVPTVRVLLVDDNAHIRQMYAHALHRAYDAGEAKVVVESVEDGAAALERVTAVPPVDLVLTDLNMPVLDGFEFVRRMRTTPLGHAIPVVVITAEDPATEPRLQTLDVQAVLHKPVQLPEVVTTVRTLLGARRRAP